MQLIGQMVGSFKVLNLIRKNKNFPEDPIQNYKEKLYNSVETATNNFENGNDMIHY